MYFKKYLLALATLQFLLAAALYGQETTEYENLKVLSPDTTREELGMAMLQNLQGLGLPRRQREGCLYCHVGSMDLPVGEWDFASDDKATKAKARVMMQMVKDINTSHIASLDGRIDDDFQVTCYTCHAGRTDPRPLAIVIRETWATEGVGAATGKYRELRERYFGAGAYDFRPAILSGLANGVAGAGAWDDALVLATLNESANPESLTASRARFTLQLNRQIEERDVSQALQYFVRERANERPGVVDLSVLDGLGWGIYRQERIEEALQIFRSNVDLYPDEYIPNESLGDALWFSDDLAGGIAVFEIWVAAHPENDMGRRRLLNMQEEIRLNRE